MMTKRLLVRHRRARFRRLLKWGLCSVAVLTIAGCGSDYPPLTFEADGNTLRLSGVIDERALSAFHAAMQEHPGATQLVFEFVPGSLDDESNLKLARQIRERQLSTIIPADGLTASGGTDLFLAGTERILSPTACVGVHTWGDEQVGIGSEIPKDDPIHQFYLEYYAEMGVPEAFYWFTLEAAGPDDSHWVTAEEIEIYRMGTRVQAGDGALPGTDLKGQCELRFEQGFERLFALD